MTEPVCLGPVCAARRFVLVGDHYQLPPLVAAPQAERGGLALSLFKRLAEAHPAAVCRLSAQYRMTKDVMAVANELVYAGHLRCGSAAVATASLVLPFPERLPPRAAASAAAWAAAEKWVFDPKAGSVANGSVRTADWLRAVAAPERRVVFVDTDAMEAAEVRSDGVRGHVHNPAEAELVARLAAALVGCGLPPADLALITPYNAQLKEIRRRLPETAAEAAALSVDRCQGKDYGCVVLSMVRSNGQRKVGTLLADWRRLNVAFTRAKRKLVVVGSRKTLAESPLLAAFGELAATKRWVVELPPRANELYGEAPAAP